MGQWSFWPPVDVKPLKILKPELDRIITSWAGPFNPANFCINRSKVVCSPYSWSITLLWLYVIPSLSFPSFFSCRRLQKQESRAVARKPRDEAAVVFGLKFADDIHYKFKSSQASKARVQSSNNRDCFSFKKLLFFQEFLLVSANFCKCWTRPPNWCFSQDWLLMIVL